MEVSTPMAGCYCELPGKSRVLFKRYVYFAVTEILQENFDVCFLFVTIVNKILC